MDTWLSQQTILVLAPHTDDAELGCGATISKLLDLDANIFVATFSSAEASLPKNAPKDLLKKEFFHAMNTLGIAEERTFLFNYPVRKFPEHRQEILEQLIVLRRDINPGVIFLPSSYDVHQDHTVIHEEGVRAFKSRSIFAYELPWNQLSFSSQLFVTLSEQQLKHKWETLSQYKSQVELKRPYFCEEFIVGQARTRGVQIQEHYAEAFEILRIKI